MEVKLLLKYGIITVGVLLLIDAMTIFLKANVNAGFVALGILSVGLIIYGMQMFKLEKAKWLHIVVAAICLIIISFSGFLAFYGNYDNTQGDEDVVIVLGAGVRGERVTRDLANRLDKAVEYHAKNPKALIIVSGGQGIQERITEALAMERYLIKKGIPAKKILKEEKATSTYENFLFVDELLKQKFPQGYSAVFITNTFHIYRAEGIAKSAGVTARHLGAKTKWYAIPANYLREMMAVVKFWVIGR